MLTGRDQLMKMEMEMEMEMENAPDTRSRAPFGKPLLPIPNEVRYLYLLYHLPIACKGVEELRSKEVQSKYKIILPL
jgi:hypothetical protein